MAAADVITPVITCPNPVLPPAGDATETVLVSATVLSSDLFTPFQEPRVTLPTIGEQQQALQPLGGKSWGGSLADYGGIGGLSHLGIHRVKDLPVSRSHRHYQSGLAKHLPPPMRTDPSQLQWDSHNPSSWPGFHAYTSHKPRFEVFPTGDSDKAAEHKALSTPGTRLSQPLSESSRAAISAINRGLYQRTSYKDSFPDYTQELRRTAAASLPSRLKKLGVIPVVGSEYGGDSMYFPVFSERSGSTYTDRTLKTRDLNDFEEEKDDDENKESKTVADEDTEKADAEIAAMPETPPPSTDPPESDTSLQKSRATNKSVSFNETPQVMEDTIRKFDITPNKPMTGVGPNWPPSTSQVINGINGSQLLERRDITQYPPAYRSALKQSPDVGQKARKSKTKATDLIETASQTTMDASSQTLTPPPKAPPLPPALTRQELAAKRSAPLQPLSASQKALAMLSQYDDYDDDIYRELNLPNEPSKPYVVPHAYRHNMSRKSAPSSLPALKKTKSKVFNWSSASAASSNRSLPLPPAPLSDFLTPAGRRVPHRLGLRYKTQAHQRYHSVHPESVPDLRNSRTGNKGKRYFFYGSHSSVYRG